jgi:Na+/H+ antiporter NhaD/arsenite permease-like protein
MEGLDGYAFAMIGVFIIGYVFITIEHVVNVNKATTAILMAIICWCIQFTNPAWEYRHNVESLGHHLASISQIVFFLLGALTIVETINVHRGFNLISDCIQITSKRYLLWIIGLLSFFLSAILDNLTTTIVMLTLLRKLIDKGEERLLIGGAVVIAANAGGAWTPIGDVTTTMLWIGGQVSTLAVMKDLFIPSVCCMIAAFLYISFWLKGSFLAREVHLQENQVEPMGTVVLILGVLLLICVPVFKVLTGLPPFMGMLLAMGILWAVTDLAHRNYQEREHLRVAQVLSKIDLAGTLFFFLGILLCIDALDTALILQKLSGWLSSSVGNMNVIAVLIGLASAVVDNVPLVAATMGMYDLSLYPQDHSFWQMVAYCAGTGGSILIIGSAAGVVYMSIEKANFFWYLKRIALPAFIGYAVGIAVYFLQ